MKSPYPSKKITYQDFSEQKLKAKADISKAFKNLSENNKNDVLESILVMAETKPDYFKQSISNITKIFPAYGENDEETDKLFKEIISTVICTYPDEIKKIPNEKLEDFADVICGLIKKYPFITKDIIKNISEDNLLYFAAPVNEIIEKSSMDYVTNIIYKIPPEHLSIFKAAIIKRMKESSSICEAIIAIIPNDQLKEYADTIKSIMMENPNKCRTIIDSIPNDQLKEYADTIKSIMTKNPDKCRAIIDSIKDKVEKKDLKTFIEVAAKAVRQDPDLCYNLILDIKKIGMLEDFDKNICRVMAEHPAKCSEIIKAIPVDQLNRFYKQICEVIEDDRKYSHGIYKKEILEAIPESNTEDFFKQMGQFTSVEKNPIEKLLQKDADLLSQVKLVEKTIKRGLLANSSVKLNTQIAKDKVRSE